VIEYKQQIDQIRKFRGAWIAYENPKKACCFCAAAPPENLRLLTIAMSKSFSARLQTQIRHLKVAMAVRRHFENFWLILLTRLKIIRLPLFLYRIHNAGRTYSMLGRPTSSSSGDIFVLREVLADEIYKDALACVKGTDLRIIDIGANIGAFTTWANSVFRVQEAYCFEPEQESFQLLNFNLSQNGCTMAKTYPHAVGGTPRTVKLSINKNIPAAANIYDEAPDGAETVSVVSFGEWMSTINGNFDILKMDCEGAEWEIIRHTDSRQFERFQTVMVEVHPDPQNQQAIGDFKPAMEKFGFETLRWDNKSFGLYVGHRRERPSPLASTTSTANR
jgi:FkbM family methyltransferase